MQFIKCRSALVSSEILLHGLHQRRSAFQNWVARSLNEAGANWATRELCSILGIASHPRGDVNRLNNEVKVAIRSSTQPRDPKFYWAFTFDNLGWLVKSTATWFHSITCCWVQLAPSSAPVSQLIEDSEPISLFPTSTDFTKFRESRQQLEHKANDILQQCSNWFSKQRAYGLALRFTPILPPVHVMKKLDTAIIEDEVDLAHRTDDDATGEFQSSDECNDTEVIVSLPQNPETDNNDLYQFEYFRGLLNKPDSSNFSKHNSSSAIPKETKVWDGRAVVEIEPSWIMDLAKKTSTDSILEHALQCTPPQHPVILGGDGKPIADLFHTLLNALAKSCRENIPYPYERVILTLGPMHVKHVLLKCFTSTFRGTCNLDEYLNMIGRDTEGKRNFTLGNGDTRVVEDMLYALGTAYQLCLRHTFNSTCKQAHSTTSTDCNENRGAESDFELWRQEFEKTNAHVAMFGQIGDLHCLVEMLDMSVRQKDFSSWLVSFRLLSRLFVCNHNTSYVFIFFEYMNQFARIKPNERYLLAQSFSIGGATMNIGFDTFVEKINRFFKSKLSAYTIGMIHKLRRLSVLANLDFSSISEKMPDISKNRLQRRANMLTWAVIFINKIQVFNHSSCDSRNGFVPPGDNSMKFRVNIEWSKVMRSNIDDNTDFPTQPMQKYHHRYYSSQSPVRQRYSSKRASLPCLPLSHDAFHAFVSRGESTDIDLVYALYTVTELRDECRKYSKPFLGLQAPSRALKLELAEAICNARQKMSEFHYNLFV